MLRARLLTPILLLGLGCAGTQSPPESAVPGGQSGKSADGSSAGAGVSALPSAKLAEVPAGTFGPYLGSCGHGKLVVWAAPEPKARRAWFSLALDPSGSPMGEPLRVADAADDIGLVTVRPAGGEPQGAAASGDPGLQASGFVLVSTRPGTPTEVQAMLLGPRGELQGGPTLLGEADSEVLWIDAVPTGTGTLVLWAVRRDDRADLFGVDLGVAGEKQGAVQTVLRDARAWQVAQTDGGAAVAAVQSAGKPGNGGTVAVAFVDGTAAPVGKPVTLSDRPTASLDVDLTRLGNDLVVAWSDRREIEAKVYLARMGARGQIQEPPKPVTGSLGDEALVQLVSPFNAGSPAYLVWENLGERQESLRAIRIARIGVDGTVAEPRARLTLSSDDAVPEFSATANGVAALTLAPACLREQPCDAAPTVPTFVAFDQNLDAVASEPMRLDALGGSAATLSWSLRCEHTGCVSLAALEKSPAPVYAVRLQARSQAWTPAGDRLRPSPPPRAVSLRAVAEVDPVHDVSVVRTRDSVLAGWVTYFDPTTPYKRRKTPAEDGRLDPLRALLQVQPSVAPEQMLARTETVSLRARSLAGVSLVPGRPGQDEALLVWSAIDKQQPQVFLSLLDARGKRKEQRMLTRNKGEVSDLAAANVGEGWLVAWIDDRTGDTEVYLTRVNRRLRRESQVKRLTEVKGTATGISMQAVGEHTQVVWADARDPAHPGWADIYGVRVANRDGEPVGPAQPVAATPAHSHSPALSKYGDGLALAWLESGAEAKDQATAGVRIAQLDAEGRFVSPPDSIRARDGRPTSLTLDCAQAECRVVISVDTDHGSELQAFVWKPRSQPEVRKLMTLIGPSGQAIAPALVGDELYFADQNRSGQGRVQRLLLQWH